MAAITARSAKKRVSYHDLHNLSTLDLLFDEKKKKRKEELREISIQARVFCNHLISQT